MTCSLIIFSLFSSAAQATVCSSVNVEMCQEELSILVNEMDQNAYLNVLKKENTIYNHSQARSWEHAHCSILAVQEECDEGLGSKEVMGFARSAFDISLFTQPMPGFSSQSKAMSSEESIKCDCIEKGMAIKSAFASASSSNNEKPVEIIVDGKIREISKDVVKSFGKKMVNEYAHHYEDGMFFLNHSSVLSRRKSKDLLCRGAERFEKSIRSKCPEKDKELIDERMELMFSELNFPGTKSLKEKLAYIDYNTVHRRAKDEEGRELTYLRSEFDRTRYGLKQTHEFQVLDIMLTNLLAQNELDSTELKPGYEMISSQLSDLFMKDFDGTIQTIFKNKVPKKFLDEWKEVRSGPHARTEFESRFKRYLLKVAPSHPGLSTILLDPVMFSRFKDHAKKSRMTSAFHTLENDFNELEKFMEDRCQIMVEHFSDVVCLEDEEILNGLSKDTLASFLDATREEGTDERAIQDLISCRGGMNSVPALSHLNKDGSKIVNSDFFLSLDNKDNPQQKRSDAYTTFANHLATDSSKRELISFAARSAQTGKKLAYDPLKHYHLDEGRLLEASSSVSDMKTSQGGRALASVSSTMMNTSNARTFNMNMNTPAKDDSKDLAEIFSHRDDKEEISSHLSKLESQELNDLKEFRRNVLSEREESLKLKLEEEKKNLENLKKQIENLTVSKTILESTVSTQGEVEKKVKNHSAESYKTSVPELKEATQINRMIQGQDRSAALSGGASGGAASVSTTGTSAASLAQARTSTTAASPSRDVSNVKDTSITRPLGLVVHESSAIVNNKQEITKNIVEFLKGVDSETFLKFTREGVVYKYKTLEDGILVEKEIHVSMNDVDPLVLKEIVRDSELKISNMQRKYSYEALRIIISEEALKL